MVVPGISYNRVWPALSSNHPLLLVHKDPRQQRPRKGCRGGEGAAGGLSTHHSPVHQWRPWREDGPEYLAGPYLRWLFAEQGHFCMDKKIRHATRDGI